MSSDDRLAKTLARYLNVGGVITYPLSTLSAMFFLYGTYTIIFGLSLQALSRRDRDGPSSKLYMGWTITLFVLATIYVSIETWGVSRQATIEFNAAATRNYRPLVNYLQSDRLGIALWTTTASIISNLMNGIADSMLIHRCYVIWDSKELILYPLALVAFILNALDLACIIASVVGINNQQTSLLMTASAIDHGVTIAIGVFQIILAFLTGGRIWSISRQARELMGRSSNANKKHTAIVAIIIESGSLYACALFTFSVVEFTLNSDGRGEVPFGLETIVMLISGIAPTLIIVRVAYGKTVDSVHQMVSTLHFADGRDVQQGSTSERQTVVDLQLRTRSDVDVHLDMDKPFSPPAVTGEKMV